MKTEHINITMPHELREEVDQQARRRRTKRSTLIQHAVKVYLKLSDDKDLTNLLREGYIEMADEMRRLQQEFEHVDAEAWKYVD